MFKYQFGQLALATWKPVYVVLVYISFSSAVCNKCQANHVACINSTSYYFCFGEETPNTDILYHCNEGFDCTHLNAICVQSSYQRPPSCPNSSLCGMCAAHRNYLFACLSRTTFRMCHGASRPTGQVGYCPSGYVCHSGSDTICVSEQTVEKVTCDIVHNVNVPQRPSTLSPTAPTTTGSQNHGIGALSPTELCNQQSSVGLYPPIPNDPLCRRYIHCYYSNGKMKATEYRCSSRTYFHIQQQKCVFNRPTYCK